jgi:circadian clock protein KaiC
VLTGSSRLAQEAKERTLARLQKQETDRKRQQIDQKALVLKAQIAALQREFSEVEQAAQGLNHEERLNDEELKLDRSNMAKSRA